MKVHELRELLHHFDPEMEVLLSSDPEGNEYYFASGADDDSYVPADDMDRDRTDECQNLENLKEETEDGDDPTDGYVQVVCIYP